MKTKNRFLSILYKICDFYELYLSSILLLGVVILFCTQIFIRYCLNGNTFYVYEASIICFGWTSIIGASYSSRKVERLYGDGHVRFSILSDLLKGKAKQWLEIILSLIILVSFSIMVKPTIKTIKAYKISKTTILRVPYSVIYFPFLLFMLFTAIHEIVGIYENLKTIFANKDKEHSTVQES